eukprot:CAMPEP_0170601196 /NCGR_PEP_ID=MMETSP0224-20130122/17732_1 /TAXON_ID=285029 /ORGANISM="Togula jolla, Strain CCCM 725" /LENGTH=226 /DNA_ID=CAMNT_0010925959 /DNA_START=39 /DNA_END=719 /DNA_ORIENTATION=-
MRDMRSIGQRSAVPRAASFPRALSVAVAAAVAALSVAGLSWVSRGFAAWTPAPRRLARSRWGSRTSCSATVLDSDDAPGPAAQLSAAAAAKPEGPEEGSRYKFKYGWDNELGKWFDAPRDGTKWWQQPSYLTPNGYPEPPHWSKRNYELCLEELKLAKIEFDICEKLKARGMTIEEIRAKAALYEFIEDDDDIMSDKLRFLMQVSRLYKGEDPSELVDMRSAALED